MQERADTKGARLGIFFSHVLAFVQRSLFGLNPCFGMGILSQIFIIQYMKSDVEKLDKRERCKVFFGITCFYVS